MLARKEWDKDYIEARAEFVKLRDAPDGLGFWARPDHKNSPQTITIKNTLNDYELIAVGIREGILDEDLYKRWFKTAFLKDWEAARPFVNAVRVLAKSDAIFSEADWMASRWRPNPQLELPLGKPGKP